VTVKVELRFRRNFWDLMETRGWNEQDFLMEAEQLELSTNPWYGSFIPLFLIQ
jgi:hypothetical protein